MDAGRSSPPGVFTRVIPAARVTRSGWGAGPAWLVDWCAITSKEI